MTCSYFIDGELYSYDLDGAIFKGEDMVLFNSFDNPLLNIDWIDQGFSHVDLFTPEEFEKLYQTVSNIVRGFLVELNYKVDSNFKIEDYHKLIQSDDQHQEVISRTRFLRVQDFQNTFINFEEKLGNILGKPVSFSIPELDKEILILRISRPNSMDINPLHRDGYLNIWKNVLNLWIPIAGCSFQSSLPIIPKSHFWNEKDVERTAEKDAFINGKQYHVPAIVSYKDGLNCIRTNPNYGQALIFTPFLVHGGAFNLQPDITRMSLELRLYIDS